MIKIFNHYLHRRTLLHIAIDSALIIGALIVAMALQAQSVLFDPAAISLGLSRGALMAVGILVVNFALGLYDRASKPTPAQIRARAALSFLFSLFIVGGVLLLLPLRFPYSNDGALTALLITIPGILVVRLLIGEILPNSYTRRRVLILGTGARARDVGKSLQQNDPNIELVGYLAGPREQEPQVSERRIIAPGLSLPELAKSQQIDEIIVALSERRGGSMSLRELLDCKLEGVRVVDVATHFEQFLGQIRLDAVLAGWLIFGNGFNQGWIRSVVKRLFDIVGGTILLLLAGPIMIIAALAILVEGGRPILYSQERVGRNGRIFKVVKFRSMRKDAEKDGKPQWASAKDARVTRVGKLIRKTRIDELPQIFCVLKGDMSLVGPRPERAFFVDRLISEIPYYAIRHSVKPGLTGWAQVRYPYGASVEDAKQKLQYDLYYVKNHSWFLDLVILFETVGVVLTGKGAQ